MSKVPQSFEPPVTHARRRTAKVQEDLEVASAELNLAHHALERHLPPQARHGDVAWAVRQNAVLERRVQEAAEELEEVTELLHEEEAQRDELERQLAEKDGG